MTTACQNARATVSRAFLSTSISPATTFHFSTTPASQKVITRDNNRHRAVSVLRRSGPREPLSVSKESLPKPSDYKPKILIDPTHGLWGFFSMAGKLLRTPKEDSEHGRPWTVEELRKKDWEDLHKLWWTCVKERNLIATAQLERIRTNIGFGHAESRHRDHVVRTTMKRIKATLTERYYLWEDARDVALQDSEINLSGEGDVYKPNMSRADDIFADEIWEDKPGDVPVTPSEATSEAAPLPSKIAPGAIPSLSETTPEDSSNATETRTSITFKA